MTPFLFFVGLRRDGRAMRARIRAEVQGDPGIHVAQLAERLGVSWHTACYHLGVLAKARHIQLEKQGRERRVFPAGMPARHRQWLAALRTEQAADVLRMLVRDPRLSVPTLSRRMGFSEKIVRRQIERLADAGLVSRRGELRPVYEPTLEAAGPIEARWLERRLGLPLDDEGFPPGPDAERP